MFCGQHHPLRMIPVDFFPVETTDQKIIDMTIMIMMGSLIIVVFVRKTDHMIPSYRRRNHESRIGILYSLTIMVADDN